MNFDKLFDLIDENKIEDTSDKNIAELVYSAQRDWGDWKTSIINFDDFITELERRIQGETTKTNLIKLNEKFSLNLDKNAWEVESLSYLLDIFKWTEKTNLKSILNKLSENLKTIG